MKYVEFNYLYRDAHNYKQHNSVVFSNPLKRSLTNIEEEIRKHLIEGEWFEDNKWNLPDLHFEHFNIETDLFWHEFNSVEFTEEPGETSIEELFKRIS